MNKTEYFVFHKEWYELKKELSAKAWIELEDYMLKLRFDGIDTDPKSIKNKTVRLQWIMIRKKIYDSINNMNRQKKHRNQNTTDNNPPIEQNIPIEPNDDFKVEENNIPCNVEQQEEQINNSNNPKPEEDMGNPTNIIVSNGKAVIVNEPAVEYRGYSKEHIEEIKRKLIEKNTPNLVNAVIPTNDAPVASNIPSFQDFITKTAFTINDIIQDYNDGSGIRKMQGDERLRELLNTKYGRFYKEELIEYINNHVNIQYKADLSHSNIEDDNLYHQENKRAKNDPKTDFISDEEKYGTDIVDFIDDNPEIITALKSVVEYRNGDNTKQLQAQTANEKINNIIKENNYFNTDFIQRLEKYTHDYMVEYQTSLENAA